MASYNGSRYLQEQLESILCQLGPLDELVISDDHSTDDTLAIIERFGDRRIRVIQNPSTRGHVTNFVNAMKNANGEFIVLSDQDDVWTEGRLSRMLDTLKRDPKCPLLIGDFLEFDEAGTRDSKSLLGPSPSSNLLQLVFIFLGRVKYFGSAFAFRRELLQYVLPIPKTVEAHDIWIAMIACLHGGIRHLCEVTLMRRLHGSNLTPSRRRPLPAILKSRFGYLKGLVHAAAR